MKILAVCTGNLCRSPLAEAAIARALDRLGVDAEVESAGLGAVVGHPAADLTIETASECGLDLRAHRARMISYAQLEGCEMVVVMERWQQVEVQNLVQALHERPAVHMLGEFLPGATRKNPPAIPDPIGGKRRDFEATREAILEAVEGLAIFLLPPASGSDQTRGTR